MRRLIIAVVLAFAVAFWMSRVWAPEPLEERLVGVQLEAVMPQQAELLAQEPLALRQILLDYVLADQVLATKARLAVLRYGDMARDVLLAHSAEPEFRAVLREYGEQVVPPIHFFTHNELPSVTFYQRAGEAALALRQRLAGEEIAAPLPLTAPERGRFAIRFIARDGHDFLGQFLLAALAYIVVKHPSLLNAAFGHLAEVLGRPVWLVQTLGWGLVLLPLFMLMQWLLRPLAVLFAGCGALLRWCDGGLSGRARERMTY